jgi:outer membrane protein assembly factor BamB
MKFDIASGKTGAALLLFLVAVMILGVQVVGAGESGNWPTWRGPDSDGVSGATGLPVEWSEGKNVVWKVGIHGRGYSSPVVWGNQVWLTTATKDGKVLYAVCIDLETGKTIHDVEVFRIEKPQKINKLNSYATPSAAVEKGFVYVHYGTHGTACINSRTGKVLWRRDDLNCKHMQGPVSSPVLFENLVIVHLEGTDVQFNAALNKKTGETVWKETIAEELYAKVEKSYLRKAYDTQIIVEVDGKAQLVGNGSQLAGGYDPRTGRELWRVVYGDDNTIASCISGQGMFFVNTGGDDKHVKLWAVRHGGRGDVTESGVVWKVEENVPQESSPVLAGGLLYMVSNKGVLTCLEAKTGKVVWSEQLEGEYGASLLYADGRIYISNKEGKTTVIKPGREFRRLAVNELDGFLGASPAVAGKSLLLRSDTHLYRIEGK